MSSRLAGWLNGGPQPVARPRTETGEQRMARAEHELRRAYGASVIRSWLIAFAVIMFVPVMIGLYVWLATP
jgi:hypothetical protein